MAQVPINANNAHLVLHKCIPAVDPNTFPMSGHMTVDLPIDHVPDHTFQEAPTGNNAVNVVNNIFFSTGLPLVLVWPEGFPYWWQVLCRSLLTVVWNDFSIDIIIAHPSWIGHFAIKCRNHMITLFYVIITAYCKGGPWRKWGFTGDGKFKDLNPVEQQCFQQF